MRFSSSFLIFISDFFILLIFSITLMSTVNALSIGVSPGNIDINDNTFYKIKIIKSNDEQIKFIVSTDTASSSFTFIPSSGLLKAYESKEISIQKNEGVLPQFILVRGIGENNNVLPALAIAVRDSVEKDKEGEQNEILAENRLPINNILEVLLGSFLILALIVLLIFIRKKYY